MQKTDTQKTVRRPVKSPAAREVEAAARTLRHARQERSNSDIVPLRSESQEGYGVYALVLGSVQRLFGRHGGQGSHVDTMRGDYDRALTVMALANRVEPVEARELFMWLYGDRDHESLTDLAGSMYHRVTWPTDAGRVDPRVGMTVCVSVLLRHYWFRNGRDYDYQIKPMSPTRMSEALGWSSEGQEPRFFRRFQERELFPLLKIWENTADAQILTELISKGFVGG